MPDNVQGAPIIPAGTQPTVFGKASFQGQGQAPTTPESGKSGGTTPQAVTPQPVAPAATSPWDELRAKKGFQTPDDLARSYMELESHNKKVEMGIPELVKAREPKSEPAKPAVQEYGYQAQPANQSQPQNRDEAVEIVNALIAQQVKPLNEQIALQNLFMSKPDAPKYAARMAEIVRAEPGISWVTAYTVARAETIEAESFEKGKQEAFKEIQTKQGVMVGGGPQSGQRAKTGERTLESIIADRSTPFSEVTRIMKEQFSQ